MYLAGARSGRRVGSVGPAHRVAEADGRVRRRGQVSAHYIILHDSTFSVTVTVSVSVTVSDSGSGSGSV